MPKRAITQLFLDRITPPKTGRVSYHDTHQPGLALRVSASGQKTWSVVYWVGGRQVRETLGTVVEIPNVAAARARALASQTSARAGINPVAERRVATERAAANTLAGAVVLPRWGDRPLVGIAKADVLELLNDKAGTRERRRKGATEGAAVQANRVLTRLRTFFGWAMANDLIAADPTAGVRKPAKEKARDRVLSDDEIRAFWAATETLDASAATPLRSARYSARCC